MHRQAWFAALICAVGFLAYQSIGVAQTSNGASTPTIDSLISLERVGSPEISPDGRVVAYTLRRTDWDDNAYHTEIWLADVRSGDRRQLTSGKKSSSSPAWSPDGLRLAFASDRDDKRQIYLIDPSGGEGRKLTSVDEGVGSFAWSPDGASIAFTSTDAKPDAIKEREKTLGDFEVVDHDHRQSHLWVIDVTSKTVRRLTKGDFTIGEFSWSPNGKEIAFDHRINGDNSNRGTANISVVQVTDGSVRTLVTQDGPDTNPIWSPDGKRIAFESAMAKQFFYYTNTAIAIVPAAGGTPESISTAFDENPSLVEWTPSGLFFTAAVPHLVVSLQHRSIDACGEPACASREVDWLRLQPDTRRTHDGLHRQRRDDISRGVRCAGRVDAAAQADGLWCAGRRVAGGAD